MLSFKHLTIENARYSWFGRKRWSPILSDINLTLHRGEIVALVGGSGEGKACCYKVLWPFCHKIYVCAERSS